MQLTPSSEQLPIKPSCGAGLAMDFLNPKPLSLLGLTLQELTAEITKLGEPAFKAKQIWDTWM